MQKDLSSFRRGAVDEALRKIKYSRLDGISFKDLEGDSQVLILDLTRCRGYDEDDFKLAAENKNTKHHDLAQHLEDLGSAQVQIFA